MVFDFKFALTTVLLASTALFIQFRHRYEVYPARQPLVALPHELGAWHGMDVPIAADVRDVLGHGDFLSRVYSRDSATSGNVDLFMAYFPSQRTGDTIHSPQHCLPGSGWYPLQSGRITLSLPGHAPFEANRYLVAKGSDRALVVYWYWAHDRAVASEYWAKFYLVADAIRWNRTDGALVRLIANLGESESAGAAEERLVVFAAELSPLINRYAPP